MNTRCRGQIGRLPQRRTGRRAKVLAIRTEDDPVVKRLRHDAAGWWLVSDNKAYEPRPVAGQ